MCLNLNFIELKHCVGFEFGFRIQMFAFYKETLDFIERQLTIYKFKVNEFEMDLLKMMMS